MSVTQDYKVLTLTLKEKVAVEAALRSREIFWLDMLKDEQDQRYIDMCTDQLVSIQSALAKVRA